MRIKVHFTLNKKLMQVKIKKLIPAAQMPVYATPGAACFDICTTDTNSIQTGDSAVFPTGLSFEIPEGHVMKVFSRSGHGFKQGLRLSNGTGIIDSDYRGELMVKLHNDGVKTAYIAAGERIAQGMIVPVEQAEFVFADSLSDTERGTGGLGSTGTV
jgi:dUTP pyrophosphatase